MITGNLKTMEFAELLQFLARGRKTGTLVIDNGRVEKRIIFENGTIISSASSDPKEYLGHFLVSHGFLNEDELAQVMELQRARRTLLGKILTTIGVMSEEDLEQMLLLKAEETIYDVFSWSEGDFRFLDDELPESPMVPMTLDVTRVVLNGVQRHDEWRMIRQKIPSVQAVPVVVGSLVMPDEERARLILEQVDDDRSIEEIALQTHATEFQVCKVLHQQLEAGKIKVVRPRPLPARSVTSAGAIDVGALVRTAETHLERGNLEPALRHLQAARSLDPDNSAVQRTVSEVEQRIRREIERAGVVLDGVVESAHAAAELEGLSISPQEGFVLSRVNGRYDVETILKISPLPRLEAQMVLWKLLRAGHVRIQPAPARKQG